ncbi:MAG: hypothetical protein MJ137_08655 [Clostridia bacterium]|nr:hypothetical protein [Clostridia bacterium]
MMGRYGAYGEDELNRFMMWTELVCILLAFFRPLRFLYFAVLALIAYSWFRTLSRNIAARNKERQAFLRVRNSVKGFFRLQKDRWRDRNTHRYYRCPECRAVVRITKPGRGRSITITCPKCGKKFDKRT